VLKIFTPNTIVDKSVAKILLVTQLAILLAVWSFSPFVFLPKPMEVINSFGDLWRSGIVSDILTSVYLNIEAILFSIVVSLVLSYLTVIPAFENIGKLTGKLRFSSMVGLTFFFTLMASNGHQLKLYLLIFSISVFYVTSMIDVISNIPKVQYDLVRTLRMGEWRIVWEVVVLGQIDKAFDVTRQNAAMGFMLLTLVESMSRSEGGIGAILLNQNKYFHLSAVMALQIIILVIGIGQDFFIKTMKGICCPYAVLALEKK
jgi:NitT/TauT family transport system permease protein